MGEACGRPGYSSRGRRKAHACGRFDLLPGDLLQRGAGRKLGDLDLKIGELAVDLGRHEAHQLIARHLFLGVKHVEAEFLDVNERSQAGKGRLSVELGVQLGDLFILQA